MSNLEEHDAEQAAMTAAYVPVSIHCKVCGGEDVTRDGLLEWSKPLQQWVMCGELDGTDCNTCDGEAHLEERAIP